MRTARKLLNGGGSAVRVKAERLNPKEDALSPRPTKDPDKRTYSGRVAINVKSLRASKEITREAFCVAVNKHGDHKITVPTVYAWENGNRRIEADYFPAIAKALGVTLFELLPPK